MTLKVNTIYCGDSIDMLKGFEDGSVDLCYIDPPFFTSKYYETIWGDGAEKRAFDDRWAKAGDNGRYSKDINIYLNNMEPIIQEIHRILKPTGSFYLHCDYHADAYLRASCDKIFSRSPQSVIIWKRTHGGKHQAVFGVVTDTILFYTKSDKYTLNQQYYEYTEQQIKKYTMADKNGSFYKVCLDARGAQKTEDRRVFTWEGCTGMWRCSEATLDEYKRQGLIIIEHGKIYKKVYMSKGVPIPNLWDDIELVGGNERLGYPTQKPEALLERIIKASSNVGDVVLDAFCGCGTTLAVSRFLMRSWVGIDVSPTACRTIASRIRYPFKEIIGLPMTAEDVAALTGYEFQNAVIRFLDPTLETIKVNNKGADGGIDGSYHGLLISVKKYKAGRKDLDEFVAMLYRNSRKRGMFIALEYTADFTKEVARLGREQKIAVYAFTLADIIAEKHKGLTRKEDKAHGKL